MGDFATDLNNFDGVYPPSWNPNVGETLVGVILRYDRVEGTFAPVQVATVKMENRARCKRDQEQVVAESGDEATLWISPAALRTQFANLQPKPGERIGVKRLEDGHSARQTYKRYEVRVDRDETTTTEPDFGAAPSYREQANAIAAVAGPATAPSFEEAAFSNDALAAGTESDLPF